MSRQIIIDEDTLIGYDYPNKQYYITNKGTTTYRATSEQAKKVIDIVAPTNAPTEADIQYLEDHYEALSTLHYTLSAKGDYISTIQLNDLKKHPLTIDLEKHKLYIMNTNIVYDLTLQEGLPTKVATVVDYYKRQQGLLLTTDQTKDMLEFLQNQYYTPTTYLQVETPSTTTEPIRYAHTIATADYQDIHNTHYTLTINPNSEYSYPTTTHISNINSNRVLTLTNPPTTPIAVGDKILIANSTLEDTPNLTSDGTYTVSAVELPYIKVAESLLEYQTPYKQCYLASPTMHISSANRENSTITLSATVPNSIVVGDTIYVEGTTKAIDFQDVSIDGTYTVKQVSEDTITTEELIPTNYSTTEPNTNTLTKRVPLGDILQVSNNTITLSNTNLQPMQNLQVLVDDYYHTIVSNTSNTITVAEDMPDYLPPYAELQVPTPYTTTLVSITKSNKDTLPLGEFMVDNYTEANSYLGLGTTLLPTDEQYDHVGQLVPTEYHVSSNLPTMHLMGLYTEIYVES